MKLHYVFFILFVSTLIHGVGIVNIIDWPGPCAIGIKDTPGDEEWVFGAFQAGLAGYLYNPVTHVILDSVKTLHPDIVLDDAIDCFFNGDSLFAIFGSKALIYDIAVPSSSGYLDEFDFPRSIDNITCNDSAVFILAGDSIYVLSKSDFLNATYSEITSWYLGETSYMTPTAVIGDGRYLYYANDDGFIVVSDIDSTPNIVYCDTAFTQNVICPHGDTILHVGYSGGVSSMNLFVWVSDSLIGPVLTTSSGVFLTTNIFPGNSPDEFWTLDDLILNKVEISHDSIIISDLLYHRWPENTEISNTSVYFSWEGTRGSNFPAISAFTEFDGERKTLHPNYKGVLETDGEKLISYSYAIRIYNLTDPEKPTLELEFDPNPEYSTMCDCIQILDIENDTLIVFWNYAYYKFYDISDSVFIEIPTTGWDWFDLREIEFCDDYLYSYSPSISYFDGYIEIFSYSPLSDLTSIRAMDFPSIERGNFRYRNGWIALFETGGDTYFYDFTNPYITPPVYVFPEMGTFWGGLENSDTVFTRDIDGLFSYGIVLDSTGPYFLADSFPSLLSACKIVDSLVFKSTFSSFCIRRLLPGLDISDPIYELNLSTMGGYKVIGDYVYLDSDHGIVIIDISDLIYIDEKQSPLPEEFRITTYPNPFNSSVTIIAPLGAEIDIYDINGRKIIPPCPPFTRGEEEDTPLLKGVDSQSESGGLVWQPDKSLGSGIYLIRAKIGDTVVTCRVVYLQ